MSRVVLITGGAKGIGLACAQHFAKLGDKVAITYNTSKPSGDFSRSNVMSPLKQK